MYNGAVTIETGPGRKSSMPQNYDEQVQFFQEAIIAQKSSLRLACILAGAVLACGITAAVFVNYSDAVNGFTKTAGTIAACFSTLFSGFPLRDYPSQRSKIKMLGSFIDRYKKIEKNPELAEELEFNKLQEIYWSLVKKTAGV
jgi:hypothetical protein